MFWKRADNSAVAPSRAATSATWSITRRLTLFYTLPALGLLLLATLALYQLLVKNLKYEDSKFIAEKIHDIRTILQAHAGDLKFLEEEIQSEGLDSPTSQYRTHYSRLLDEAGWIEIETPGMTRLLSGVPFPPPRESVGVSGVSSEGQV